MERLPFDEYAGEYDGWFMKNGNVLASEVLLIRRFLEGAGRTLSVGCGSGLFEMQLRREHGIEIGAGLGPFKGEAWRIGLMGASSTRRNVTGVRAALETILADLGVGLERGAALAAAGEAYTAESNGG